MCRSRSRSRDRRDRDRSQAGPKSLDFAARQAARGDGAMEDWPREGHPRDGRNMRADRDRDLRPSDSTRSDRGPGDSFRHRDREDRGQGRPGEGDPAARANGASSRPIAAGNGAGLGVPMVQGGADLPAAPKKDPLSLDELLKKKQEEQAAIAKVRWLAAKLLGLVEHGAVHCMRLLWLPVLCRGLGHAAVCTAGYRQLPTAAVCILWSLAPAVACI